MKDKDFSKRVYDEVVKIPRGKVATYGQIAMLAGSPFAYRAVGNILHKNPHFLEIPCHRVVNSKGKLSKYFGFGGVFAQKELLVGEGVEVNSEFTVDLKKFIYKN